MSCLTFKTQAVYDFEFKTQAVYDFKFKCEPVCSVRYLGPDFLLIVRDDLAITFGDIAVGFRQDNA